MPKFLAKNKKTNKLKEREIWLVPWISPKYREWSAWKNIPPVQNIREEVIAWANIIIILNSFNSTIEKYNLNDKKFIWQTEEKAINLLISLCTAANSEPKIIPNRLIQKIKKQLRNFVKQNNPQPPNFNKIPAKRIEPAVGASTWAFGSQ